MTTGETMFFISYVLMGVNFFIVIKNYAKLKKEHKKLIEESKIKSKALCNACEYEHYCADRSNDCRACGQYAGEKICKCYEIEYGEECKYFKPIEKEGVKK